MKTNKLKLNDLKVNSFITALNDEKSLTVQGGTAEFNQGSGYPNYTITVQHGPQTSRLWTPCCDANYLITNLC